MKYIYFAFLVTTLLGCTRAVARANRHLIEGIPKAEQF